MRGTSAAIKSATDESHPPPSRNIRKRSDQVAKTSSRSERRGEESRKTNLKGNPKQRFIQNGKGLTKEKHKEKCYEKSEIKSQKSKPEGRKSQRKSEEKCRRRESEEESRKSRIGRDSQKSKLKREVKREHSSWNLKVKKHKSAKEVGRGSHKKDRRQQSPKRQSEE